MLKVYLRVEWPETHILSVMVILFYFLVVDDLNCAFLWFVKKL